jgi:hypothetical protein
MKKFILSMACCLMMLSIQSFAQEDAAANDQMKAWMDYMTPGQTHQMLAKSDGTWKTKITMWMTPDAEPTVSEGTSVNEMILGGRYQKSTHKGNFMGMEMEGMNLLAFDNASQEFYSTWIDNMGTGMMTSKGKYNEGKKLVEMSGTYVDPMTKTEEPFRQTFQVVDDNNQVMEMFMKMDGKEFKCMHIEYTRQ